MVAKRTFQLIAVIAILVTSFASAGEALAGSGSCPSSFVVQWGDTLNSIAATCGTTVEAIKAANPNLSWWLYAGLVLNIPTGTVSTQTPPPPQQVGSTYTIQWGDTLGGVALKMGFSLSDILAVNPQIWNASLIFPGQVINLPASVSATPVSPSRPVIVTSSVPPYASLTISYKDGLMVRTGPGKEYAIIQSPYISSIAGTKWQYRKNSITIDSQGYVWVEVKLNVLVEGYSAGWILVRDTLGRYYTQPLIDP